MASKTEASPAEDQAVAEDLVRAAAEGRVDSLKELLRAHHKAAVNWTWQPLQMTPVLAAVSRGQIRAGELEEPCYVFMASLMARHCGCSGRLETLSARGTLRTVSRHSSLPASACE